MGDVIIFSTKKSKYFADLISKQLNIPHKMGKIERKSFGDKERYLRIRDDVFGKKVIFVASTHTDEAINEVVRLGYAFKAQNAEQCIYAIPFFGYSTMERAVKMGEVVMAKVIAKQLSDIPKPKFANTFILFDLHASGILEYFEGDCQRYELYGEKPLIDKIRELNIKGNVVFGSADLGRPLWVKTFAKKILGTEEVLLIDKSRDFEKTKINHVIGSVKGRIVIIYDDMTRSAGTIIDAVNAYLAHGAVEVHVVMSHCALNNTKVVTKIENSGIKSLIVTNSHPMSQSKFVKNSKIIKVVDASSVFAESINKILS